ncbi:MAG: hypothetical protein P1P64_08250 [Treponemataceae bacterium]
MLPNEAHEKDLRKKAQVVKMLQLNFVDGTNFLAINFPDNAKF